MTDRELLELAAKAAGIAWLKYVNDVTDYDSQHYGGPALQLSSSAFTWNPLTDDGDALRLAVKLGMSVVISDEVGVTDARVPSKTGWCTEQHWDNTGNATRRAIVRAAAEIGKAM